MLSQVVTTSHMSQFELQLIKIKEIEIFYSLAY